MNVPQLKIMDIVDEQLTVIPFLKILWVPPTQRTVSLMAPSEGQKAFDMKVMIPPLAITKGGLDPEVSKNEPTMFYCWPNSP